MTWLISDEARKHRAFREVWVAYLLGGLYLLLGLYTEISEQNYSVLYDAQQKWYVCSAEYLFLWRDADGVSACGRIAAAGLL